MADFILITIAILFGGLFGAIANSYVRPRAFSSDELGVMAIALVGFIVGVVVADWVIVLLQIPI